MYDLSYVELGVISNCILIGDESGQCFPEESLTLHKAFLVERKLEEM